MTELNVNPTKVFDSADALESFSLLSDKLREMVFDDNTYIYESHLVPLSGSYSITQIMYNHNWG